MSDKKKKKKKSGSQVRLCVHVCVCVRGGACLPLYTAGDICQFNSTGEGE